jgi:hypothetical protein
VSNTEPPVIPCVLFSLLLSLLLYFYSCILNYAKISTVPIITL